MTDGTRDVTVYTIGHSNVATDIVVGLLQRYGIAVVVDVRSVPYSQYTPQFNRETLIVTLRDAGIAYRFAGEYLGGRPKDSTCYRSDVAPKSRGDYLKLVDYGTVATRPWYQRGINRLRAIAGEQRTAVLCSEEDPDDCHRQHLIAQTLISRGVPVYHIRHKGTLEAAKTIMPNEEQLSLFGGSDA